MSIDLLRQIAATPLPISLRRKEDVDAIKMLRQAGLLIALLDERPECCARVLAITEEGRNELLRFHYPGEGRQPAHGGVLSDTDVVERMRRVLRRSIGAW